jgi:uncharacterized protein YutE (UPF0331/DUF86 family)
MSWGGARKGESKRWRREIVRHLEDFPRQYAALESAMAAFGEHFDLQRFKQAFETNEDMEAYNRVQAVERALGRVQNFLAELADDGVRLAGLPPPPIKDDGSPSERAFEALRNAKIIEPGLCRRLIRAQKARSRIEHSYVQIPAGDVHEAARLVLETAGQFIGHYRAWIGPLLEEGGPG